MGTEPDDKWSYGAHRKQAPEGGWPPPAAAEAGPADPADTVRLSTGRWTSPSLGAYDPAADERATGNAEGADPASFDGYGQSDTGPGFGSLPPPDQGLTDHARHGYADDGDRAYEHGAYGEQDHEDGASAGRAYGDRAYEDRAYDDGAYPGDEAYDDDYEYEVDYDGGEPPRGANTRRNLIEWAVVLVGAVLLALILRAVLLQAFWIPSPSMESTLLVRDRVLVNKLSYRLHDINRGDVIVFRRTDDEIASNPELPRDVIKRVIALEGETIAIEDNVVTINGNVLLEPYLDEGVDTSDFGPSVVPEGHVFVMGDNRELSLDSRFETGPIAEDRVVGRAFFLFWPLSRMGSL